MPYKHSARRCAAAVGDLSPEDLAMTDIRGWRAVSQDDDDDEDDDDEDFEEDDE